MALQIKDIRGRKYVYDVKSYWDKELKKYRKHTVYMGPCVNEQTKEYAQKKSASVKVPLGNRNIVNYGDVFLLNESLKQSELCEAISGILPKEQDSLKTLMFHKIIDGGASNGVANWYDGSIAKILFPDAQVESQRISEFFERLSNETVQRAFFKRYLAGAKFSGEVVIDSTGLVNEINIPLTEYSGKSEQNEMRFIMVIDRITHMPLYFRLVAGNIVDVSTLTTTFKLTKNFGLNPTMVVMDAGYYSFDNIRSLCSKNISFLTRLPCGRKLYKTLIEQTAKTLEAPENIAVLNKRSLFVQKVKIDLYGYAGFAYVCQDIKEAGKRKDKFIRNALEDRLKNEEIEAQMPYIGKFILVSNKELLPDEILPLYYARQIAENTFSFAKSRLELTPLRTHNLKTLKGYVFLSYLSLLLFLEIANKLKGVCTLTEALALAHNQFAEIFDNKTIPLEPNRRLKEVYKVLEIYGS